MFHIGSCRINSQAYLQNHVHNTKQILITLNYLINNENKQTYDNIHMNKLSEKVINTIKTKLKNSKKIIIEISSLKIWRNINKEEIHWGKIKNINHIVNLQSKEEFLKDLQEITKLLSDKKIIFVSHINCHIDINNQVIDCNGESRWISNNFINKNERKNINDIVFINNNYLKKIKNRELIEQYIDIHVSNTPLQIIHFKPYDFILSKCNNIIKFNNFFEENNNSIDTNHYSKYGIKIILNHLKGL